MVTSDEPPWLRRITVASHLRWRFLATVGRRFLGRPIFVNQEPTAAEWATGLVLVLPGVEAAGPFPQAICQGLRQGGWSGAVEIFYWGIPFPEGYFPNVMWLKRNQVQARRLATRIMAYQQAFPGRPVHIVGNSAGAAIGLMAVELLPADRPIGGMVFLQGAIDPDHDLSPALRRLQKGIMNCYSPRDWIVLGLGTLIFGTVDRRHCFAAGCRGFQIPSDIGSQQIYSKKLIQLQWSNEWIDLCDHWGSHGSSTAYKFVEIKVMPWLQEPAPDHLGPQ